MRSPIQDAKASLSDPPCRAQGVLSPGCRGRVQVNDISLPRASSDSGRKIGSLSAHSHMPSAGLPRASFRALPPARPLGFTRALPAPRLMPRSHQSMIGPRPLATRAPPGPPSSILRGRRHLVSFPCLPVLYPFAPPHTEFLAFEGPPSPSPGRCPRLETPSPRGPWMTSPC